MSKKLARPWFWLYFWNWFGVVLVWFGFGLIQITHLRLPFNSQDLPKSFYIQQVNVGKHFDKTIVWAIYLVLASFVFLLYFFPDSGCPGEEGSNGTSGSSKGLTPPEISRGSWKQYTLVLLITSYLKFLRRKRMLFNYFPYPLLSFRGIRV